MNETNKSINKVNEPNWTDEQWLLWNNAIEKIKTEALKEEKEKELPIWFA